MQLVIIAGGQGTRLKERIADLPKPMVEIGGKPLLEHQILLARKYGIEDILILTGFGAECIESYFGDGAKWGVRIAYHRETQPLGTAGAVLNASANSIEVFMVMYGDTMLNVDLRRMIAAHPPDALASLFLHPNDHPQDSDLVEVDDANRILALHPYPHPRDSYFRNLVNAALYVVNRNALPDHAPTGSFDFGKHLFPDLIASGAKLQWLYQPRIHQRCGNAQTARPRAPRLRVGPDSERVLRNAPVCGVSRSGRHAKPRAWLAKRGGPDGTPPGSG